jgi:hypothetical protein
VSKDVQVTGYEDGSERPTRPKYDAAAGEIGAKTVPVCDPCDGDGGTYTPPVQSGFISSEGKGGFGLIYNLQFIKDSNPLPAPEQGYTRIDVDLNKGVGGKYIYLQFTRNSDNIKSSHPDYNYRENPVTDIIAEGFNTGLNRSPQTGYSHIYEHTCQCVTPNSWFDYKVIDLNDGAGGKYIYAYLSRWASKGTPITEVGVLYGNSSNIQPPAGWIRVNQDLNEGAGGDYIYICYRR